MLNPDFGEHFERQATTLSLDQSRFALSLRRKYLVSHQWECFTAKLLKN